MKFEIELQNCVKIEPNKFYYSVSAHQHSLFVEKIKTSHILSKIIALVNDQIKFIHNVEHLHLEIPKNKQWEIQLITEKETDKIEATIEGYELV